MDLLPTSVNQKFFLLQQACVHRQAYTVETGAEQTGNFQAPLSTHIPLSAVGTQVTQSKNLNIVNQSVRHYLHKKM